MHRSNSRRKEFAALRNGSHENGYSGAAVLIWTRLTSIQFENPTFQIRRVLATKVFNPTAPPTAEEPDTPHSMTAIRTEGKPTISGNDPGRQRKSLPLETGWATYITGKVEVTPVAYLLFVTARAAVVQ